MDGMREAMFQTVSGLWSSLMETPIQQIDVPGSHTTHDLVGCIHLTGPDGGVVTLECSVALAREVASAMFDLPAARVENGEAEDALAEMVNVTAGNFKALLNGAHVLSLPTVVGGRDFRARFVGTKLAVRMSFDCGGQTLVASFHRDGSRANPTSE